MKLSDIFKLPEGTFRVRLLTAQLNSNPRSSGGHGRLLIICEVVDGDFMGRKLSVNFCSFKHFNEFAEQCDVTISPDTVLDDIIPLVTKIYKVFTVERFEQSSEVFCNENLTPVCD